MNKKIRDSHLALELLHDVEESVVDIWLVVELDLESEEGAKRVKGKVGGQPSERDQTSLPGTQTSQPNPSPLSCPSFGACELVTGGTGGLSRASQDGPLDDRHRRTFGGWRAEWARAGENKPTTHLDLVEIRERVAASWTEESESATVLNA